jgi:hypothetical protein
MERFNLKILKEAEGKEQYFIVILNKFATLENLHTEVDINRFRETVRISKFL